MRVAPNKKAKPIRILLIAPSLAILGGQAVQAQRILAELRKHRFLRVGFLPINPQLPGRLRALQQIRYVRTILTTGLFVTKLLGLIWKYDILHVFAASNTSFLLAPTPAVLLAKLFRKRTILNYRDGRIEQHLTEWKIAVPLIRLFDEVVVQSGYLVEVFGRFGVRARCIPNIVDTKRFSFRERPKPRPVFLHNRSLEPLYNVECTLRAFAVVQQRYPDAQLTLAHDGPLRPRLEKLAVELGSRNVRFIGKVPPGRVPELYAAADIYLTSPNLDNMPGSLLECFASGLPIVATRAGGIPYIVEDEKNGLLVERGDHQAMAACILRLLEEDGLALRLARAGVKECHKYRGALVLEQWISLYRRLS